MSATNGDNSSSSGSQRSSSAPAEVKVSEADQAKIVRAQKKFIVTCAVFARQARVEGRGSEFKTHVFSRFWLLWPLEAGDNEEDHELSIIKLRQVRSLFHLIFFLLA